MQKKVSFSDVKFAIQHFKMNNSLNGKPENHNPIVVSNKIFPGAARSTKNEQTIFVGLWALSWDINLQMSTFVPNPENVLYRNQTKYSHSILVFSGSAVCSERLWIHCWVDVCEMFFSCFSLRGRPQAVVFGKRKSRFKQWERRNQRSFHSVGCISESLE